MIWRVGEEAESGEEAGWGGIYWEEMGTEKSNEITDQNVGVEQPTVDTVLKTRETALNRNTGFTLTSSA